MCFMLSRGPSEAGLLFCPSPAIPRLAGIWAFWQGRVFWLPGWCSAGNFLFLSTFHAGCRITVILWLGTSATLLTRREMFAVTYWPLLVILLFLRCYRSLWPSTQRCYKGFLVNSEPMQCYCLP